MLMSAAAAFLIAMPAPTMAEAWCTGTVTYLLQRDNGGVEIYSSWRNQYSQICSLTSTWKGITPQACFGWFATLGNSVALGKAVTIYYVSITQAECATMPTYDAAPAPQYVQLNRQ
jgi:hypothetical protein